ncbi:MAG: alpha/beta hydrolase, partial [Gammaproteobacteria bacterium]
IENSGAETVHILGHSMGGFAVVEAFLYDLLPNDMDTTKIGEFVLLAPDIDAEIFRRDIGPKLVEAGLDITLYASSNDKAMASSQAINGYPRAGDTFDGATIVPGIETIDATAANNSILGHSYFEESQAVGSDLAELLNHRMSAADRARLTAYKLPSGIYWRLDIE